MVRRRQAISGTLFVNDILRELDAGSTRFVHPTQGSDGADGLSWESAKATLQDTLDTAADEAGAGDVILIAPTGEALEESVTIPRALHDLAIIGVGGRGSVYIETPAANGVGLTNLADDVRLFNIGCGGDGTGAGLVNYGDRLRAYESKFEGADGAAGTGARLQVATVAQEAADSHGTGADVLFQDCEFAWSTQGVRLMASDYGAVTQPRFVDCQFHDNSAADFEESGGSVDIRYRGLEILRSRFQRLEDGSEPTKYVSLNDDNGNTGQVADCVFPTAINGAKNLVSTKLLWVSNKHTGGISTGQPS